MNINRLHLVQFQTHNSEYNYFISVIPGDELSECIGAEVNYQTMDIKEDLRITSLVDSMKML